MSKTGSKFGPYEIVEKIGQGGMGVVYRAREERLQRDVALKVLPERLASNRDFTKRFLREAQSAARIEHPGIVSIYGVGEEKGTYWIAMQLVSGKPLADSMQSGPVPWEKVLDIGRQTAAALDFAHKQGVIHRDIKPDNIMVDDSGHVKIMDFGLAKAQTFDAKITESGVYLGTPEYSSPEQCESQDVDGRSDLYSLGVVLYEALTGQVPHSAETPYSLFKKIVDEPPRPIREINPEVPPSVAAVVNRMMEKDRDKRYQSAKELIADIDKIRGLPRTGISDMSETEALGWRPAKSRGRLLAPVLGLAGAAVIALVLVFALSGIWGGAGGGQGGQGGTSTKPDVKPSTPADVSKPAGPAVKDAPVVALVFDFKNLNNLEEIEWMRIGVPEMLITDLAQLQWIRVASREKVLRALKELSLGSIDEPGVLAACADKLDADILIKGTFIAVAAEVNIDIQVLSHPGEDLILSDHTRGPLDNLLSMIDDLTRRIRRGLEARFRPEKSGDEPSVALRSLAEQIVEISAEKAKDQLSGAKAGPAPQEAMIEELLVVLKRMDARKESSSRRRLLESKDAELGDAAEESQGDGPSPKEGWSAENAEGEEALADKKSLKDDDDHGAPMPPAARPSGSAGPRPPSTASPTPTPTPSPAPARGGAAGPRPETDAGPSAGYAPKPGQAEAPGCPANEPPAEALNQGEAEAKKDKSARSGAVLPAPDAKAERKKRGAAPGDAEGGAQDEDLIGGAEKALGRLKVEITVKDPTSPLVRATRLVFRAKMLREAANADHESLSDSLEMVTEALDLVPGFKLAVDELEALKAKIQEIAK